MRNDAEGLAELKRRSTKDPRIVGVGRQRPNESGNRIHLDSDLGESGGLGTAPDFSERRCWLSNGGRLSHFPNTTTYHLLPCTTSEAEAFGVLRATMERCYDGTMVTIALVRNEKRKRRAFALYTQAIEFVCFFPLGCACISFCTTQAGSGFLRRGEAKGLRHKTQTTLWGRTRWTWVIVSSFRLYY